MWSLSLGQAHAAVGEGSRLSLPFCTARRRQTSTRIAGRGPRGCPTEKASHSIEADRNDIMLRGLLLLLSLQLGVCSASPPTSLAALTPFSAVSSKQEAAAAWEAYGGGSISKASSPGTGH